MYIIEILYKFIKNRGKKISSESAQDSDEIDYEDTCKHVFLPIDSTGETLACSKCGFIVKKDDIKFMPRNPFN